MADAKTVRLRNITSGVVVETSEENAARLAEFEPADKPKRSTRKASSDDE